MKMVWQQIVGKCVSHGCNILFVLPEEIEIVLSFPKNIFIANSVIVEMIKSSGKKRNGWFRWHGIKVAGKNSSQILWPDLIGFSPDRLPDLIGFENL